jgi:hypothetical protein
MSPYVITASASIAGRIMTSAHACSEIGQKWFLFLFHSSASNIGLFGRQQLVVLKGRKSWMFQQIAGAKNDVSLKTASKSPKRN